MKVKEYIDEHSINLQILIEGDDYVVREDKLLPVPNVQELIGNVKQELIDKACEWLYQQQLSLPNQEKFIDDFQKYMEGEK